MSAAGTDPSQIESRINYRRWFWRVLAWDGILPLIVWIAPYLLAQILPNREEPRMLGIILTAIGVFLLRWFMGSDHVASNHCSSPIKQLQYGCFFAGLVVMLLMDALLLALHGLMQPGEWLGMAIILVLPFSLYLVLMAIAMYPGREPAPSNRLRVGNWEVEP